MRRIVSREFGPVGNLAVEEAPDPAPADGEVVVAVEAAAVSFVDGLIVEGRYQVRPPLPYTPGSAVAGRVQAVGRDVARVSVGDPVGVLSMGGGGLATPPVAPRGGGSPVAAGPGPGGG